MTMRQSNYCSMILGGFFLLALGCYFTWKNEANQVCSTGAFEVASEHTHEMGETCSISDEHSDLFLHLTCPVDQESLITTEPSTGISAKGAYKLTILTEQYSYVASHYTQKKCKSALDANGVLRDICSDESESCTCFDLQWTTTPVSSNTFSSANWCDRCNHNDQSLTPPKDKEWGNTPATKIGNFAFFADQVPLGDGTLEIDQADIPAIKNMQPIMKTEDSKFPTTINANSFKIVDSNVCGEGVDVACYYSTTMRQHDKNRTAGYYNHFDVDSTAFDVPLLGDLRMKVRAFSSTQISALGKAVFASDNKNVASIKPKSFGGSVIPPCKPRSIFYLTNGKYDADELYKDLQMNLNTQTVIFRILSLLVVGLGFHISFSPLKKYVQALPVLAFFCAPFVEYVMFLLTVLATGITWLIVFATAWVFYRPFLGLLVVHLVIAICFGVSYLMRKKGTYGEVSNSDEAEIEMDSVQPNVDTEVV